MTIQLSVGWGTESNKVYEVFDFIKFYNNFAMGSCKTLKLLTGKKGKNTKA